MSTGPKTTREILASLPVDTKVRVVLRGGVAFEGGINETPDPDVTLCLYTSDGDSSNVHHHVIDMADIVAFSYRSSPAGIEKC